MILDVVAVTIAERQQGLEYGRPVRIGRHVWIGAGAIVGAGSVVTRDVAAGVTVAGNPARPLGPRFPSAGEAPRV